MTLRVGLVGFGLAGTVFHAPLITSVPDLELAGIVTSQRDAAHAAYPGVAVFATLGEMLAGADVALVVIATPNTSHLNLGREAIAAGKHVVIDKPFTITSADADDLLARAHERGVMLSVYQNRRWDNDFLTVRRVLASGALGEIVTYEAHYDRFKPEVNGDRWREQPQPGAGVLYDLGPHLLDQALTLFGTPRTVWADVRAQRPDARVDDYFHVVLDFDRTQAIVHAGSIVRATGPRFQLHGTRGSFIKYGLDTQEDQLKAGLRPGAPGWGEDPARDYGTLTTELDGGLPITATVPTLRGSYEAYYQGVADHLVRGAPVPVTAESARANIRVIELARQSAAEGRRLPFA